MKSKKNNFTRRDFLKISAVGAAGLALANSNFGQSPRANDLKEMLVYIGTYTSGKNRGEGIYIYKLNFNTGNLTFERVVKNVVEPSYLEVSKNKKYLYAVNETENFEGKKSGAVSAFAINQQTGDLTFLNKQPSLGGAPCHVSISKNGKFVLVANYSGGNVAVFPVEKDGRIGAASDLKQHSGTGANKARQESAHAHSINLDEDNRFAVACDLGIDKIMIYRFDRETGKLQPHAEPFFQTRAGAGPRHFTFHPNEKFAYVINELDSSVTAFDYGEKGILKEAQIVSTLPEDWTGANTGADLHLSPNGKFLYASNRGHHSLAVFSVDEQTGKLTLVEHTSTGGKTPRNFAIEPHGRFLLAANQNSDSIVVFQIDEKTGRLSAIGKPVSVPAPVCLKLIPAFV